MKMLRVVSILFLAFIFIIMTIVMILGLARSFEEFETYPCDTYEQIRAQVLRQATRDLADQNYTISAEKWPSLAQTKQGAWIYFAIDRPKKPAIYAASLGPECRLETTLVDFNLRVRNLPFRPAQFPRARTE